VEESGDLGEACLGFLRGKFFRVEGEEPIFLHRHVGIESKTLKTHGYIPFAGGNVDHSLPIEIDLSSFRMGETRYHTEYGGFTASGWTGDDTQAPIGDGKGYLFEHHAFSITNLDSL